MIKEGGILTAEGLIEHLTTLYSKCVDTATKKNSDYSASENNAFRNFEAVEYFGISETKEGIMVRLTDKFTRISNLLKGKDAAVKNETIMDTIEDAINYLGILHARFAAEKKMTDESSIS